MGKKPNMRDVAGEESNPGKRGNPGVVKDVAYLQSPVINSVKPKPKPSKESGTNTYAKNNQKSIDSLNKIYKRYKAAKDEISASTREKGRG